MKQITNNTLLKQVDTTYQPIEIDGVIYWVGKVRHMTEYVTNGRDIFKPSDLPEYSVEYAQRYWQKIVAQSQPKLDGVTVVNLRTYIDDGQYTLSDIERVIELAQMVKAYGDYKPLTKEEILEQINSISIIEVDELFKVISYDN